MDYVGDVSDHYGKKLKKTEERLNLEARQFNKSLFYQTFYKLIALFKKATSWSGRIRVSKKFCRRYNGHTTAQIDLEQYMQTQM